ncbi:MAG: hypothetical protein WDO15_06640 [Bacteroidota bacterium]
MSFKRPTLSWTYNTSGSSPTGLTALPFPGQSQYIWQDRKFYLIEESETDLSTNKSKDH